MHKLKGRFADNLSHLTRNSYDSSAQEYAKNVFDLHPIRQGEQFIRMLPKGASILDVGCGSGRDAKIFSEKGLMVIGVDFSAKMIETARKTAPKAEFHLMDLEDLRFSEESFDGVWASCSLLHIPKEQLSSVLSQIQYLLKKDGVLYLSVKKGHGEVIETDQRYGGLKKFWSFFQEEELKSLLANANFTIQEIFVEGITSNYQTHPYIKIFAINKVT